VAAVAAPVQPNARAAAGTCPHLVASTTAAAAAHALPPSYSGGRSSRLATIIQLRPAPAATAQAAPAHRRGGGHTCPAQLTGGGRPHLVALMTAAAAAHALPPSYSGGRRLRLATIIQRRPPLTATAPTAAAPRKHCSRAAHVRPPHPSHTQHTCGSRPHLASRTTEVAAVDTRNSGGCRATPLRQPRYASAAAEPVSTSAVAALVTRHRQPWPRRPGWSQEQARRPPLDMSQTSAVAAT